MVLWKEETQQNTTGSPWICILLPYPKWTQHRSSLFILDLAHAMVCEESTEEILKAFKIFPPYIKPIKQKQQ